MELAASDVNQHNGAAAMNESVRSMIYGPSVLYVVAAIALVLTIVRKPQGRAADHFERIVPLFLVGVAFQCLHFTEEFNTGFYVRAPQFLGFVAWSPEFFVTVNLIWMALWVAAAVGLKRNLRIAFFPIWFFAVAMVGNAIWHPLLALATGGYFPGLYTCLIAGPGPIGFVLVSRLKTATEA
ncbi:MAG: hypothetical protein ABR526_06620 [Chthoniobacterales bacterium]